jgi:hypothetical protein
MRHTWHYFEYAQWMALRFTMTSKKPYIDELKRYLDMFHWEPRLFPVNVVCDETDKQACIKFYAEYAEYAKTRKENPYAVIEEESGPFRAL